MHRRGTGLRRTASRPIASWCRTRTRKHDVRPGSSGVSRHLEAGFAHTASTTCATQRLRGQGCTWRWTALPEFSGLSDTSASAGERLVIAYPRCSTWSMPSIHAKYGEHSRRSRSMEINAADGPRRQPGAGWARHVLSANVQWAPHDLKGWLGGEAREAFDRQLCYRRAGAPRARHCVSRIVATRSS